MSKRFLITGTDTGVGKTHATAALLHALQDMGKQVIGVKPVASGCNHMGENADILALQAASSYRLPSREICSYLFTPPIAPHIAANDIGIQIELSSIQEDLLHLETNYSPDVLCIEGFGGFFAPLNESTLASQLSTACNAKVILVIGLRLGCLNHALLTYQAIQHENACCVGYILNEIDPHMTHKAENIAYLQTHLPIPHLGTIPYDPSMQAICAAKFLSFPLLEKILSIVE